MNIHNALRFLRIYHDLKQRELAEKLGFSKPYISELESGKKMPTIATLEKYAVLFDVPVSSIIYFAEYLDGDVTEPNVNPKIALLMQTRQIFNER